MVSLSKRIEEKKEKILRVARERGASNLRVFGSVARGEADERSDLDLLIDLEAGRSLLDQASLTLELESLLGCRVDVVTAKGIKDRMRERVLREAVPL